MTKEIQKKCPICNSDSAYIFTSKNNKDIFNCSFISCGHFFTPVLNLGQGIGLREEDLEKESDESLKIFDKRNEKLLIFFESYLKDKTKPLKFLDFGAGNAHIARTFKRVLKDKCIIYCLEKNPLFENFYSKYNLEQIKNISDLPEKIDLIYMIEVIEHLEDPISVMKSLRHLLEFNGMVFISTPLGKSRENLTNAYEDPSHLNFFTKKSLNFVLKKSGFTEIEYKFHPEMHPPSLNRSLISQSLNSLKLFVKIVISKIMPSKSISHLFGITKPKN